MDLVDYAKTFIGIPYKWGGEHPAEGYDCSGFIQEILASKGLDPRGDQTAHMLFNRFLDEEGFTTPTKIERNDILFFGDERVTHIALAIDDKHMIEAGGGNSKTVNTKVAIAQKAMIRIRPINIRKDLYSVARIPKKYVERRGSYSAGLQMEMDLDK